MPPRSLIHPPTLEAHPAGAAILAKGFRPFFLMAAAYAVLTLPLWVLVLYGRLDPGAYLGATGWHAHEMVFGFSVAVIAGFLLTAVGNWTQRETAVGLPLALLCLLWLAGRVAVLFADGFPPKLAAALDLAFLPALAFACARPILASKNRRNYGFIAILAALFGANLAVHLGALGVLPAWTRLGSLLGVDLVTIVIVIVTGRIVPMFTRNATGRQGIVNVPVLDRAAIAAMVLVVATGVLMPGSAVSGVALLLAGVFVAARAARWGMQHTFGNPLLWILHVGHAWVAIGLLLRGASVLVPAVPSSMGLHALTAGAIGALTLGMMARVSLGHTGRMLAAPKLVSVAFVVITVATLLRIVAPLAGASQLPLLAVAGSLWALSFAAYLVSYAPMLLSPRVDGRPG
ncbi:MAG: NnrS family protein [Polyangiaceae bacterium]|nr:NnrS family protein [Polyangiaceae bacterium]